MPKGYAERELIERLQELAERLGHPPTEAEIAESDAPSAATYRNRFGGLSAAREAADIGQPGPESTGYTDEELLTALQDLADNLGHPPSATDVEAANQEMPAMKTYYLRFESLEAAREQAGLDHPDAGQTPVYSDEKLLADLTDLAIRIDKPPSGSDIKADSEMPGPGVFRNRFGGLPEARERAGLGHPARGGENGYTTTQLQQKLIDLADRLDAPPTASEIADDAETPSVDMYLAHFEGIPQAREAAGLGHPAGGTGSTDSKSNGEPGDTYTEADLLDGLRGLADRLGRPPTAADIKADSETPSQPTYNLHFDGLSEARDAAGLEDPTGGSLPTYSDEELLEALRDLADRQGDSPTQADVEADSQTPSETTYRRRFDGIRAAREQAGLEHPT